MEEMGYLFVRINGDLLTPKQYQNYRRRRAMYCLLKNEASASSNATTQLCEFCRIGGELKNEASVSPDATEEHEIRTYLAWYQSGLYSPEEVAKLLEELPPTIGQILQGQVEQLEAVLDRERYECEVVLLLIQRIPIKYAPAIEVRSKADPGRESWLLLNPGMVSRSRKIMREDFRGARTRRRHIHRSQLAQAHAVS